MYAPGEGIAVATGAMISFLVSLQVSQLRPAEFFAFLDFVSHTLKIRLLSLLFQ